MKPNNSRIFAISDLHVGYKENLELLRSAVTSSDFSNDTVIIAGDLSENLNDYEDVLNLFSKSFKFVFYCIGNHDTWIDSRDRLKHKIHTSLEKIEKIYEICRKCGVFYEPKKIYDKVWVVPLLAWYDFEFEDGFETKTESEIENMKFRWVDFHKCVWPENKECDHFKDGLGELLLSKNTIPDEVSKSEDFVITVSHILPRRELLPSKETLLHQMLPFVSGSKHLDTYIRKLNTKIHVCGHTHINHDKIIDNVRYVQKALGYPNEKRVFFKQKNILSYPIVNIKNGVVKSTKCSWEELYYMGIFKFAINPLVKKARQKMGFE